MDSEKVSHPGSPESGFSEAASFTCWLKIRQQNIGDEVDVEMDLNTAEVMGPQMQCVEGTLETAKKEFDLSAISIPEDDCVGFSNRIAWWR